MQMWNRAGACAIAAGALLAADPSPAGAACPAENPERRIRFELRTSLGDVCIELLDGFGEAPITSQNFRNYAERGDYDQSFLHRSIPGFIVQGGGFSWDSVSSYQRVPADPAIVNEPGISNLRGTLAMAKVAGDPNSATNEWFINLADNSGNLDSQNGGFTVFARVVGDDMDVVDAIAALHTEYGPYAIDHALASIFTNLPVLSLLERDPAGYGCLIVFPDPLSNGTPLGQQTCSTQVELDASVQLTIEAMDPQVPERLVMVNEVVYAPESGATWLVAVGGLVLRGAARRRRRNPLGRGLHRSRWSPQYGLGITEQTYYRWP